MKALNMVESITERKMAEWGKKGGVLFVGIKRFESYNIS